jgi:mono/diheme cytochrome c family protein
VHHWARELVVLGASNWSGRLQGGAIEGWYAPNITSDGREGVGNWSTEQIANFLRTGASPGRGVAVGPMADTVQHSLSHLSDEDVAAIAAYLKSVPAEESYRAAEYGGFHSPNAGGGATYLTHCASCHLPNGKGIAGEIPALQGNGAVLAKGPENIIRVVLGGLPASNGLAPMPASERA